MLKRRKFWLALYSIAFVAAFIVIGLIYPEKEIFAAVLGAMAASLIWVLTYVKDREDEEDRKEKFMSVTWTEMMQLTMALTREALWWHNRVVAQELEIGIAPKVTEQRIMNQHHLPILMANLDRITDFNGRAADMIGVVMAYLRGLGPQFSEFYAVEDRLIANKVSHKTFWEKQQKNTKQLAISIAMYAYGAMVAAHCIDEDGSLMRKYDQEADKELVAEKDKLFELLMKWQKLYSFN